MPQGVELTSFVHNNATKEVHIFFTVKEVESESLHQLIVKLYNACLRDAYSHVCKKHEEKKMKVVCMTLVIHACAVTAPHDI